jgi:hypothetical protein
MFGVCMEFLYTCFGKGIKGIWENNRFGMVSYMCALLKHWNDTSGMPFGIPRCRRLNQVFYIRREFSLLEEELSLRLRIF